MREIDEFVRAFREDGWASEPFPRMLDIVGAGGALPLGTRLLEDVSDGGTFFDAALSYLSIDEFDAAVDRAIEHLVVGRAPNPDAADSVIAHASLQASHSLTPHLPALWERWPNHRSSYEMWPWRGADTAECERLAAAFDHDPSSADARRAWAGLLESRSPGGIEAARARAGMVTELWSPGYEGPTAPAEAWFDLVGFELLDDGVRRRCADAVFHLSFDPAYLGRADDPVHVRPGTHPTWFDLGDPVATAAFGGSVEEACAVCGGVLHRLLELGDPEVLEPLGITARSRVELATCLSCLGWTEDVLWFRHDADGRPSPLHEGGRQEPEFPVGALPVGEVGLVPTPARWRMQDRALANGRENLHRVGGEPTWVQSADHPDCPSCARSMDFVLQLDSLPDGPGEWLWGSGGLAYVFWCDRCAVSAGRWQCT